ncbi:MAG: alpha/beta fold hydrolase [Oscillospiraceae bacterium]|nr:alpha/beta fold hydrolase [Oscillospiraceae bacterium]
MIFEKQVVDLFKSRMYTRCDDTGKAFYFSHEDFGLQRTPYPFTASAGHKLQGYLYHYADPRADRVIVFDHGFGGGHRSYLREIEMLCRHGFLVLAYDHTGCMESGGETPNGLAQSLCDLNDCISTVKADKQFQGRTISVVGHSWGAFSTLNITALHPEIEHIVAMSGFVSVPLMVETFFMGLLRGYRKAVLDLELRSNPKFATFDAVESLANSSVKALLIYSDNDQMTRKNPHFDTLQRGLAHKENIRLLLVSGKGHNPNYTADAVAHLAEYTTKLAKLDKKKLLETNAQKKAFRASFDWRRMTAQDDAVWQEIFRTLDS